MVLLVAGLVLFGLGCCYLFQPKMVLWFNAFMRETVFRDSYVLLEGRRHGALLLLISFILLGLALIPRP